MSKTHAILILDRSGSMIGTVPITIKGTNEFIATLKNIAREIDQDITISLVGFDSDNSSNATIETIDGYDLEPAKNAKKVTNKEIFGRGGTPLYRSIDHVIDQYSEKVGKKDRVIVAVFTDGGDTDGNVDLKELKSKITKKNNAKWTFALVAANQDAKGVAETIGIPTSNAMEYQSDAAGTRSAFYRLSRGVRKYFEQLAKNSKADLSENFFNDSELQNAKMTVNGLSCTVNMPESLLNEDEVGKELPPYAPVEAHVVDEYPACPANWEHGSTTASSYFIGVKDGHGMWIDLNDCAKDEYEIAAVISVQGVNPVTGQKTDVMRLEQYDKQCPVHSVDFHQDRYCPECKYKWPKQNYLATTGTPFGQFWLDGFRNENGKVRQYVVTPEEAKGVAYNILDKNKPKEDHVRVYAIGVAFYRSKKKKPAAPAYAGGMLRAASTGHSGYSGCSGISGFSGYSGTAKGTAPTFFSPMHTPQDWKISSNAPGGQNVNSLKSRRYRSEVKTSCSVDLPSNGGPQLNDEDITDMKGNLNRFASDPNETVVTHHAVDSDMDAQIGSSDIDQSLYCLAPVAPVAPKLYEVGAGAKIEQTVHDDPNSLDYWQEEPVGFIYVNYGDEKSVEQIVSAGRREEAKEGFLAGVLVGKP